MSQEIERVAKMALLVDFYGQLLTDKQRQAMELYYGDDLSLGEIADSLEISRQAVHDLVKRSGKILDEYEEKLGMVEKHLNLKQGLTDIEQLLTDYGADKNEQQIIAAVEITKRLLDTF